MEESNDDEEEKIDLSKDDITSEEFLAMFSKALELEEER